MSAMVTETPALSASTSPSSSTYQWLTANPLASSCGSSLYSAYEGSKNYSRLTKAAFGTVESALGYVSETARPVVGKVAERLDRPITVVDETIAGGLGKLEECYPVVKKPASEIVCEGKQFLSETLQAGQQRIGNTKLGSLVGCGVDCSLAATEAVVNKILPPTETGEEVASGGGEAKTEPSLATGLRRRWWSTKQPGEEASPLTTVAAETGTGDKAVPSSGGGDAPPASRTERVQQLSYAVYYRMLSRLQGVQEQVQASLKQLKISVDLLKYAQMVSEAAGSSKNNVQQALKAAEERVRMFLSRQAKPDPSEGFAAWIEQEKNDDKDIQWLLDSETEKSKKDLFQRALDRAKRLSEQVYSALQSVSGVTAYLPVRLRDRSNNALRQAKDVYTTLKLNNVPGELPGFLLAQIAEVLETQIGYCRRLGRYLTSVLKKKGDCDEVDGSSQVGSEPPEDEEEHKEEHNDEEDEEEGEEEEADEDGGQDNDGVEEPL